MKKLLVLIFAVTILTVSCVKINNNGHKVLCGSSLILSLVKDCGGDIATSTLIPADVCPGSFDLKPEDATKVIEASIFIIQPFQQGIAEKTLKINPKLIIEIIKTPDMTIPENYFKGLQEAAKVLGKYFPAKVGQFSQHLNSKINEIRMAVMADTDFLQRVRKMNIRVIASTFHVVTAQYLGFDVEGTFEGPETLKPASLSKLIATAKSKTVSLIISNLTGTHDLTADIINKKLKLPKAVFKVFPTEVTGNNMFLHLWSYNIKQLKSIVGD